MVIVRVVIVLMGIVRVRIVRMGIVLEPYIHIYPHV